MDGHIKMLLNTMFVCSNSIMLTGCKGKRTLGRKWGFKSGWFFSTSKISPNNTTLFQNYLPMLKSTLLQKKSVVICFARSVTSWLPTLISLCYPSPVFQDKFKNNAHFTSHCSKLVPKCDAYHSKSSNSIHFCSKNTSR